VHVISSANSDQQRFPFTAYLKLQGKHKRAERRKQTTPPTGPQATPPFELLCCTPQKRWTDPSDRFYRARELIIHSQIRGFIGWTEDYGKGILRKPVFKLYTVLYIRCKIGDMSSSVIMQRITNGLI